MTSFRAQSPRYVRKRDLPRLLGLWPEEAAGLSDSKLAAIVDRLSAAIRAERRRGLSGHWAYDLNRHWALIRAYEAEHAELQRYERQRRLQRLHEWSRIRPHEGDHRSMID